MAPGNADLIRPIYAEWGRGNWRPRFDVYHPDMEWGWSDEFPGLAGVYDDAGIRIRASAAGSASGSSGVWRRTNTSSSVTTSSSS
jgi:hypothetical protein